MENINKNSAVILEQLAGYKQNDTDEYLITLKKTLEELKELNLVLKNKDFTENITYVNNFISQNKEQVNWQLEEIKKLTKNIHDICLENKELENEKQEYKELIDSNHCIEMANKLSEIKKLKENMKFFLSKKGIYINQN